MPSISKLRINGVEYDIAGSGGGGTSNYNDLINKPKINGNELSGNKTSSQLGFGTASEKNVPESGNAGFTEVVLGNDTRLSDSRPASDVSDWAKASTKPTYTKSEVGLSNVPNVSTDNQTPTVTEASTRTNIASGDTLKTIIGKIKKYFTDLKTVAFSGNLSDLTQSASYRTVTDTEKTTWNGKVNKTGDTMTGPLKIQGAASSNPLQVRGIKGYDGSSADGALYLNYGNSTDDSVYLGNTGVNRIYSNGAQYTGNAATATKLGTSNVGSATNPMYLNAGIPTACSYSLNKSVPSDAKFTDTTYNFSGNTFYSGDQNSSEHNANNAIKNGHYYYTSNGPSTDIGASTNDGALYVQQYSDSWVAQIAQDYRNGNLFVRGKNNGTWKSWVKILHERCDSPSFINGITIYDDTPVSSVQTKVNTAGVETRGTVKVIGSGSEYNYSELRDDGVYINGTPLQPKIPVNPSSSEKQYLTFWIEVDYESMPTPN